MHKSVSAILALLILAAAPLTVAAQALPSSLPLVGPVAAPSAGNVTTTPLTAGPVTVYPDHVASADSDGDGYDSVTEVLAGSDPLNPVSTPEDLDGDGWGNAQENSNTPPTDPTSAASHPSRIEVVFDPTQTASYGSGAASCLAGATCDAASTALPGSFAAHGFTVRNLGPTAEDITVEQTGAGQLLGTPSAHLAPAGKPGDAATFVARVPIGAYGNATFPVGSRQGQSLTVLAHGSDDASTSPTTHTSSADITFTTTSVTGLLRQLLVTASPSTTSADPGAYANYTVTVQNRGNANATIHHVGTSAAGGNLTLVSLAAFAGTCPLSGNQALATTAANPTQDHCTLRIQGRLPTVAAFQARALVATTVSDGWTNATVTGAFVANRSPGLNLGTTPEGTLGLEGFPVAAPGQDASYLATLTNTGTARSDITLHAVAANVAGDNTTFTPSLRAGPESTACAWVAQGADRVVTLNRAGSATGTSCTFHIDQRTPAAAAFDGLGHVRLTATTSANPSTQAAQDLGAKAGARHAVSLSALPSLVRVLPGGLDVGAATLTVKNQGNALDTFTLSYLAAFPGANLTATPTFGAEDPDAIPATGCHLDAASLTAPLPPGATCSVQAHFTVNDPATPRDAAATLRARAQSGQASAATNFTVKALQAHRASLEVNAARTGLAPGAVANLTYTLRNTGNGLDGFTVAIPTTALGMGNLSVSPLLASWGNDCHLAPAGPGNYQARSLRPAQASANTTCTFHVLVGMPAGAFLDQWSMVNLTVASQGTELATTPATVTALGRAGITLTTNAAQPVLLAPGIARNVTYTLANTGNGHAAVEAVLPLLSNAAATGNVSLSATVLSPTLPTDCVFHDGLVVELDRTGAPTLGPDSCQVTVALTVPITTPRDAQQLYNTTAISGTAQAMVSRTIKTVQRFESSLTSDTGALLLKPGMSANVTYTLRNLGNGLDQPVVALPAHVTAPGNLTVDATYLGGCGLTTVDGTNHTAQTLRATGQSPDRCTFTVRLAVPAAAARDASQPYAPTSTTHGVTAPAAVTLVSASQTHALALGTTASDPTIVEPGVVTPVTYTLRNLGNGNDAITLGIPTTVAPGATGNTTMATERAGGTCSATTVVTLARQGLAGDSCTFILNATLDALAPRTAHQVLNVTATAASATVYQARTFQVAQTHNLRLTGPALTTSVEAGRTTDVAFTLVNTGNGADQATVTVPSLVSVGASSLTSTLQGGSCQVASGLSRVLAAGASCTLVVRLQASPSALTGAAGNLTVTATAGPAGKAVTQTATARVVVAAHRELQLTATPAMASVLPGSSATFTVRLTNAGNDPVAVDLVVPRSGLLGGATSGNLTGVLGIARTGSNTCLASAGATGNFTTTVLASGASCQFNETVTVGANEVRDAHAALAFTAASHNDATLAAATTAGLVVLPRIAMAAAVPSGLPTAQNTWDGHDVSYVVRIANDGNGHQDITLATGMSRPGWTVSATPGELHLARGANATVTVVVHAPYGANRTTAVATLSAVTGTLSRAVLLTTTSRSVDTDHDGIPDGPVGTTAPDADDDNDGYSDAIEVAAGSGTKNHFQTPTDLDGDGVPNLVETTVDFTFGDVLCTHGWPNADRIDNAAPCQDQLAGGQAALSACASTLGQLKAANPSLATALAGVTCPGANTNVPQLGAAPYAIPDLATLQSVTVYNVHPVGASIQRFFGDSRLLTVTKGTNTCTGLQLDFNVLRNPQTGAVVATPLDKSKTCLGTGSTPADARPDGLVGLFTFEGPGGLNTPLPAALALAANPADLDGDGKVTVRVYPYVQSGSAYHAYSGADGTMTISAGTLAQVCTPLVGGGCEAKLDINAMFATANPPAPGQAIPVKATLGSGLTLRSTTHDAARNLLASLTIAGAATANTVMVPLAGTLDQAEASLVGTPVVFVDPTDPPLPV